MATMETTLVFCLIGAFIAGNAVCQTPSYRTESRDDEQQADIVEASQGEEAQTASELKLVRKQLQSLHEGLSQLRNDFTSKTVFAGNVQSGFYGAPHHLFHYYHPARPAPYRPDSAPDTDELSVLQQLLQTSESRLQATEYKLQATESRLQVSEDNLQRTEARLQALEDRLGVEQDGPQATESRSLSCEDKLLVTQQRLKSAETKLQLLDQTALSASETSSENSSQGSTFIRWGKEQCPNATQLVYTGVAAGSWFEHAGGAANRLCLTLDPEYDGMSGGGAFLHSVEYEGISGHQDHNAPCCLCRVPQATTVMVPATLTCPPGWVTQYTGYLVAGHYTHASANEYLCLDRDTEHTAAGHDSKNGALFYLVQTSCSTLPCPPFENNKVATCAVCSM